MKVYHSIEEFCYDHRPINVTIGNFDGVHKGHQTIIKHLIKLGGISVVITFTNHPSEVLRPTHPTPLLCTFAHKIKLLDELGVDILIAIPFTFEFSQQSAENFIKKMRTFIPFSNLVLGHDAVLGKDRQGDKQTLERLARAQNFKIDYLKKYQEQVIAVSSTCIRHAVKHKKFDEASVLLGRPYSIYSQANSLDIQKLCLPPAGNYIVTIIQKGEALEGFAAIQTNPPALKLNKKFEDNIEIIF